MTKTEAPPTLRWLDPNGREPAFIVESLRIAARNYQRCEIGAGPTVPPQLAAQRSQCLFPRSAKTGTAFPLQLVRSPPEMRFRVGSGQPLQPLCPAIDKERGKIIPRVPCSRSW